MVLLVDTGDLSLFIGILVFRVYKSSLCHSKAYSTGPTRERVIRVVSFEAYGFSHCFFY